MSIFGQIMPPLRGWVLFGADFYKGAAPMALGIGMEMLRHLFILTCEAETQAVTTDAIIKKISNAVPVP